MYTPSNYINHQYKWDILGYWPVHFLWPNQQRQSTEGNKSNRIEIQKKRIEMITTHTPFIKGKKLNDIALPYN